MEDYFHQNEYPSKQRIYLLTYFTFAHVISNAQISCAVRKAKLENVYNDSGSLVKPPFWSI